MIVRPETPEDRSRIATLIARTYLADGADVLEKLGQIRALPEHDGALCLVAQEQTSRNQEQVCAFALLTPVRLGRTEYEAVYMAPLALDATCEAFDFKEFLEQVRENTKALGYHGILTHGDAEDLGLFGFQTAENLGLKDGQEEKDMPPLLALPCGAGMKEGVLQLPACLS